MKKSILLVVCLSFFLIGQSQVSETVHVTIAGTLSSLLTSDEKNTIVKFTVTGMIDARDVKCMRDSMPALTVLDLSAVNIQAYHGSKGTCTDAFYPANEMPKYSFYNNFTGKGKTTLTAIKLPNSVTAIGVYAFSGCSGLTNVLIPNSVISIEGFAFMNCTGLTNVLIPNANTSIGIYAFYHCNNLITIYSLNTKPQTLDHHNSYTTIYTLNAKPQVRYDDEFSGFSPNSSISALYVPSIDWLIPRRIRVGALYVICFQLRIP
jgi:hypothetical protein